MKLREKLCEPFDGLNKTTVSELEKIVEDFAIGFAEWLNKDRFTQFGNSWINPNNNKDKNGDWVFYTSKQLLEIYKKEKGL